MNWEAIGTIAEMIGAVGVIISLLYLAMQVRRNTKQEEFQSFSAARDIYLDSIDRATATKEDAELFRQALNGFSSLPPNEQGVFHSRMHALLHGFHGVWVLFKVGTLPEYELVAMRKFFVELLLTPGGQERRKAFKHVPPPHLIAYLEEEAEKAKGKIATAVEAFPWLRPDENARPIPRS